MSALTDNVKNVGGVLYQNEGLMLPVKFAKIDLTATGNIVTGVAGKKIRALKYTFTYDHTTGDETFQWAGDAGGTPVALSGVMDPQPAASAAGDPQNIMTDSCEYGLFESAVGTSLGLVLAGDTPLVDGYLVYVEVPA